MNGSRYDSSAGMSLKVAKAPGSPLNRELVFVRKYEVKVQTNENSENGSSKRVTSPTKSPSNSQRNAKHITTSQALAIVPYSPAISFQLGRTQQISVPVNKAVLLTNWCESMQKLAPLPCFNAKAGIFTAPSKCTLAYKITVAWKGGIDHSGLRVVKVKIWDANTKKVMVAGFSEKSAEPNKFSSTEQSVDVSLSLEAGDKVVTEVLHTSPSVLVIEPRATRITGLITQ